MNNDKGQFGIDEFIEEEKRMEEEESTAAPEETEEEESFEEAPELDVQRAVVESLAEDKVKMEHEIENLKKEIESAKAVIASKNNEVEELRKRIASIEGELKAASDSLASEKRKTAKLEEEISSRIEKEMDTQERNPNALALLDRNIEIEDRFPGETRDHVIEALREARDRAEADGKIRRAQVIESVLVENEPNGTLAKKREELEKLFSDNSNLITGVVIEELKRLGIRHKDGETYLMPSEIIKREF